MKKIENEHRPFISVVIPVYNEEENLEPLVEELEKELNKLGKNYEVIFVDDKSTDSSLEVMKRLKTMKSYIRIIPHMINSGESAAMATGFMHARGDLLVTMDGDMQNDPADIAHMIDELKGDVVAVCGIRKKRMDTIVKKISSRIANAFRNLVTGEKISDAGCTFRVLKRESLKEVLVFNGMHRFLPTILRAQGYKVVETYVNDRPRMKGVSKYGIGNRLWRGIIDCLAIRWFKKRAVRGDRAGNEL